MKTRIHHSTVGLLCAALFATFTPVLYASTIADVVCYLEMGTSPAGGINWWNPANVLVEDDSGISLGNWQDATTWNVPVNRTGGYNLNQGNPTGLVMGFSTAVINGPGNDLQIQGNPFPISDSDYYWSEPGYIEVARETTTPGHAGATVDGWKDETFYLIKPSNYDIVGDPRLGALSDIYSYWTDALGTQHQEYLGSWGEDLISAGGSQLDLYGYADWNPSGDRANLSDAIDLAGNSVALSDIAYVRIRTVTNDPAGSFGSISTEVCYVENIAIPEPAALALLGSAGLALGLRLILRKRKTISLR